MRLTARRLNRATLARQLLLRREPLEVAEAVRRVVALQAQEAASPYLALWNRLAPFDPAGLDAAFAALFLALALPYLRDARSRRAAALAAVITLVLTPFAPAGVPIVAASAACLLGARR